MMVRAAVLGAVDFSKAQPYDRKWMGHLRVILAEISRQEQLTFTKLLHQHYLVMTTVPRLEEESFKKIRDGTGDLLDTIISQLEPWNKDQVTTAKKTEVKAAVEEWEGHYGRLDDPEVQAAIDETVIAVRRHRAEREAAQKSQEDMWKGNRKGTRRERHRDTRRNTRRA